MEERELNLYPRGDVRLDDHPAPRRHSARHASRRRRHRPQDLELRHAVEAAHRHLRRYPRSTVFVFDTAPEKTWRWLTIESSVTILEGDDAPQLNLRLFETMQARMPVPPAPGRFNWFGQELSTEDFLAKMVEEGRLIYDFDVKRTYGMF